MSARVLPKDKRWAIYVLRDPTTNRVRYVGFTSDPKRRLRSHITQASSPKFPVNVWVAKLLRNGARPTFQIIEEGIGGEWSERERFYIASYRQQQTDLLNLSDGGYSDIPSASRARAGLKLKTRYFSPEHRKKISEAKQGMTYAKWSDQAYVNHREAMALRCGEKMNLTEAERRRRAEAIKNAPRAWETATAEQKAEIAGKIGASVKTVWAKLTDEQRQQRIANISAGMRHQPRLTENRSST